MNKCTGMEMVGLQCPHNALWRNQNGVEVCGYHKLLLNAFNWETRHERKWKKVAP